MQSDRVTIHLEELAIVLSAPGAIPTLINPDFLRYNRIVDPSWAIELPVVIESKYSHVSYTNGLSLTATEERLIVSQRGSPLSMEEIVCPGVIESYLEQVPPATEYQSVQIEPVCSITIADSATGQLLSPLNELKIGLLHGDVVPEIQVRSLYQFPDKFIVLQVVEHRTEDEEGLALIRFLGRIYHQVKGDSLREQAMYIVSVVKEWQQDLGDFLKLTRQFYSKYTQKES